MVVRKPLSRQSGSWYCEVTSGPLLCVSIFAQEEFDTGAWFDGLQADMERRNRRDGCTCGNLASRRSRTEHNSRRESIFLSNAIRRQNSENNRTKTSEFYRRAIYRRTRRVSLLGPARTRTLFALRQKQKKEHRSDIRKTQSRQTESLGPEWIWPRPNKAV